MKILELHLKAFGPFTDRRLDLSAGSEGLHVVFGPNEAGKSCALRALKVLLFGIPVRSADGFLHPYEQLRVGGVLRHSDGTRVAIVRRKGLKNTLLSADGETPIADAVVGRLLGGVGEALFAAVFGIDHDALVRGGREILAERGEVGEALFAAGLGSGNLRAVLADLDAEAESLFLPRGSRPLINRAIDEYREVKRAVKEASLSGREWAAHHEAHAAATEGLERTEKGLAELCGERNRLRRLRRVLPPLAERRALLEGLSRLGIVVELPDDFGARRERAVQGVREAQGVLARAETRLGHLRVEAEGVVVPREVLDHAEAIEHLHQRLGAYGKALSDRPRLESEVARLREDARAVLKRLRPDVPLEAAEGLRPLLARRRRIEALGNQYQALLNEVRQAERGLEATGKGLEAVRATLEAMEPRRDAGGLRRAVEAARRAGDPDQGVADTVAALRFEEGDIRVALDRLGLWSGPFEALDSLATPAVETVERFEADLRRMEERRLRVAERREALGEELLDVERRIEEIRLAGSVPAEEELARARGRRDLGWRLIRRTWLDGADVAEEAMAFDQDLNLPETYERACAHADDLADRLRREADRVHRYADLKARRGYIQRELEGLRTSEAGLRKECERVEGEWRALWQPCRIDPLPPREMRPWLAAKGRLSERAASLREMRGRLLALKEAIGNHREAVAREIVALGEAAGPDGGGLAPLLARGEEVIETVEARERVRRGLEEDERRLSAGLEEALSARKAAAGALSEWRREWEGAIEGLGLARGAHPLEAGGVLEGLSGLFSLLDEAGRLGARIAEVARASDEFRSDVEALARRVAPALSHGPAGEVVVQLAAMLVRAREQDVRKRGLANRIEECEDDIRGAKAAIAAVGEQFSQLRREARCLDDDGLEGAERRSEAFKGLKKDLSRIERQLLVDGEGAGVDELAREAEDVDPDALPGRIEQLDHRIAELEREARGLYETKGAEAGELRRMDGNAAAAAAAERGEEVLSGLRADVERYLRVRLASMVLRQEIERYRAENQDPLLRRAGEVFAKLSLGAFVGLQADLDERDAPVLAGVRPDGKRVGVAGMSSGTCDQLYLSLRLATLEAYLEGSEPLPFIVDDILINFDDARSRATLEALADLSAKTQVILFTHHSRVVDLARGLEGRGGVFVQGLP